MGEGPSAGPGSETGSGVRTGQAYVDWIRPFVLRHDTSGRLDRAWRSAGMAVESVGFGRLIPAYARPALIVDAMQDRPTLLGTTIDDE
jgi:hypothetical protein